jgi:hypothetical protein
MTVFGLVDTFVEYDQFVSRQALEQKSQLISSPWPTIRIHIESTVSVQKNQTCDIRSAGWNLDGGRKQILADAGGNTRLAPCRRLGCNPDVGLVQYYLQRRVHPMIFSWGRVFLEPDFSGALTTRNGQYPFADLCNFRNPWLYLPLVEFMAAVPWTEKLRPNLDRPLQRSALHGILPEQTRFVEGSGFRPRHLSVASGNPMYGFVF